MAELYMRSWKTRKGESWCYWIDYYVDGKRVRESLSTRDKKTAQAEKRRIERDVEDGCHVRKRGTVTFGEAFQSYLEYMAEKGARLATRKSAESIGRAQLVPEFGHIKLGDLTTERVQAFVNARAKTHRWASVRGMIKYLHGTLDHAVKRKWLPRNVLRDDRLELPLQRLPRNVPEPTTEQVIQLFASVAGGPRPGRQLHAYRTAVAAVALAALALRRGEIAGLAWEDVDFERCEIHVRRSQAPGEGLGPTKTPKSRRSVPMPLVIRNLLWDHLQHQGGRPTGPVLRDRTGKMLRVAYLSGSPWTTIMRQAGLVDAAGRRLFSIHALRRWCSSHLQQQGGLALADAADHLGHAQTQTTRTYYTYRLGAQLRSAPAVERLAEELNLPRLAAIGPAPVPPPPVRPAEPVAAALPPPPRPSAYELREEAVRLRGQGVNNAETARRLGVAPATVKRWALERAVGAAELPAWAERRDRAIALYREGVRGHELAARVGAGSATVYKWLRKAGVQNPEERRHVVPAAVREEAIRLYAEGVPVARIAARLGVCPRSVENWRRAAGVPGRYRYEGGRRHGGGGRHISGTEAR